MVNTIRVIVMTRACRRRDKLRKFPIKHDFIGTQKSTNITTIVIIVL